MLNRAWKIVLLVVALITSIWSDLLGASTWWILIIALAILLISEVLGSGSNKVATHAPAVSSRKKRRRR